MELCFLVFGKAVNCARNFAISALSAAIFASFSARAASAFALLALSSAIALSFSVIAESSPVCNISQ